MSCTLTCQTDPERYLNGIYSQFVMLGLFLIVTLIIPESPGTLFDDHIRWF